MVNFGDEEVRDAVYCDTDGMYGLMAFILGKTMRQCKLFIPCMVELFSTQIREWILKKDRIRSLKKKDAKLDKRITELTRKYRYVDNRFKLGRNNNEASEQEISRLTSELATTRATEAESRSQLEKSKLTQQTYRNYIESMHVELIHGGDVSAAFASTMVSEVRNYVNQETSDLHEFGITQHSPLPLLTTDDRKHFNTGTNSGRDGAST